MTWHGLTLYCYSWFKYISLMNLFTHTYWWPLSYKCIQLPPGVCVGTVLFHTVHTDFSFSFTPDDVNPSFSHHHRELIPLRLHVSKSLPAVIHRIIPEERIRCNLKNVINVSTSKWMWNIALLSEIKATLTRSTNENKLLYVFACFFWPHFRQKSHIHISYF